MITKTITSRFLASRLGQELLAEFPAASEGAGIEFRGNTLYIGIADTQPNRELLNTVIAAHDYPAAVTAEKLAAIRRERESRYENADDIIKRHRDQCDLVSRGLRESTDITDARFEQWLVYEQELRDFPATCDPDAPVWPEKP
jgi:hypothetical protein